MKLSPTLRQLEYLAAIVRLTEKRGFPCTIRELGEALGVRSTNAVAQQLVCLEAKGLVLRDFAIPRSLRLTDEGRRWLPRRAA